MSDPRLADGVLEDLAAVRVSLQHVWRTVEELHGCARSAERTLDDVEAESSRARLAAEDPQAHDYLVVAGEQMDVLRQRCALGANLASDIEARLDTAKHQLQAAHRRLADYDVDADGPTATEVSALKAKVEGLNGLVDLAAPLAQAARTHMQGAADTAASVANQTVTHPDRRHVTLRFDRGTQHAGRALAHADEAVRHLDRTVEYASAGVTHSLGHADALSNAAHQRLRSGQQNHTPLVGPSNPSGPPR